jgi:putative tryptophan/tyrosine transport system substrate-binding protein
VIGFLANYTESPNQTVDMLRGFIQGLSEAGYVEGRNVVIEYRSNAQNDRMAALAADLVRRQVGVIATAASLHWRPRQQPRPFRSFSM